MPENLWTAADLGTFLGLSPQTVNTLICRNPNRLPPRVTAMSSLRWVPSVCHEWAVQNSGKPKSKAGRPRG